MMYVVRKYFIAGDVRRSVAVLLLPRRGSWLEQDAESLAGCNLSDPLRKAEYLPIGLDDCQIGMTYNAKSDGRAFNEAQPVRLSRIYHDSMWQARGIGRVFRTCSSALAIHEQRVRLTTPYKWVGKQSSRDFGISLVVGVAELKDIVIVRIRCRVAVLHDQRTAGGDIGSRHESGRSMSLRRRARGALRNRSNSWTICNFCLFFCGPSATSSTSTQRTQVMIL